MSTATREKKYSPAEVAERRDAATRLQNAYRGFLARIDIQFLKYTNYLQDVWSVDKIYRNIIEAYQDDAGDLQQKLTTTNPATTIPPSSSVNAPPRLASLPAPLETKDSSLLDTSHGTTTADRMMHFGSFVQFCRQLRIMDNEINHSFLYGLFYDTCQICSQYPQCAVDFTESPEGRSARAVHEELKKKELAETTGPSGEGSPTTPNTHRSHCFFDRVHRPEENEWLSHVGKLVCKQQSLATKAEYVAMLHHERCRMSVTGLWVAIYALTYAEMPHEYDRNVPHAPHVAVSHFLLRYVYRAAEEMFAKQCLGNNEAGERCLNRVVEIGRHFCAHHAHMEVEFTPQEIEELKDGRARQQKWWNDNIHRQFQVKHLFTDSSESMARELMHFERSFQHLFCKFGNPYQDRPDCRQKHSQLVERGLEEVDVFSTDKYQQEWLECLCSPTIYSLGIAGLTRFLVDFKLLDNADVKGHAKLVSIIMCASSRQALGFGTSRTERLQSLYNRLHMAKQLVTSNDLRHDDRLRQGDSFGQSARRVRVGRGWGPPPEAAERIRELYFKNHELRAEEKSNLSLLFATLDDDKSGFLDHGEIESVALQFSGPHRTVGEVYTALKILDRDHDGRVSLEELERTIVRANALHREICACTLTMPEFAHAVALYIVQCLHRKTAREAAMSQSEFFSYHMHLLASTYAEQMGAGMQEIEEGAQIRGQEAEDLGFPELHDPGLQSVEADYDLMMVDIHVQYCLMERAATTHTMCAEEDDGSLVSTKHSLQVSQKVLFLDGFSSFVDTAKLHPKASLEDVQDAFLHGIKMQHSRRAHPLKRRAGLNATAPAGSLIATADPHPPFLLGTDGLNALGFAEATKYITFLKFVDDCRRKERVPLISVYPINVDMECVTTQDFTRIYHARYLKQGEVTSFYGTYFRRLFQRLRVLYVIYQPQRVYGTGSVLGSSHYQQSTLTFSKKSPRAPIHHHHPVGGEDHAFPTHGSLQHPPHVYAKGGLTKEFWTYPNGPVKPAAGRLVQDHRYARRAAAYYEHALEVMPHNASIESSFDTFVKDNAVLSHTPKADELSFPQLVRMANGQDEDESDPLFASLGVKKRKQKKKRKVRPQKKGKKG